MNGSKITLFRRKYLNPVPGSQKGKYFILVWWQYAPIECQSLINLFICMVFTLHCVVLSVWQLSLPKVFSAAMTYSGPS